MSAVPSLTISKSERCRTSSCGNCRPIHSRAFSRVMPSRVIIRRMRTSSGAVTHITLFICTRLSNPLSKNIALSSQCRPLASKSRATAGWMMLSTCWAHSSLRRMYSASFRFCSTPFIYSPLPTNFSSESCSSFEERISRLASASQSYTFIPRSANRLQTNDLPLPMPPVMAKDSPPCGSSPSFPIGDDA